MSLWFEENEDIPVEHHRYYASLRSWADVWVMDMSKGDECLDDANTDWKHFLFDVCRRVEPMEHKTDIVADLRHEIHEVLKEQNRVS